MVVTFVPDALVSLDFPTVPSGPITNLKGAPSLSQINVTWTEIPVDDTIGIITRYEVQYTSTSGSMVKEYTDSPMFEIKGRNHSTNYTFSVTPFSLFARGISEEVTVQTPSELRRPQFVSL